MQRWGYYNQEELQEILGDPKSHYDIFGITSPKVIREPILKMTCQDIDTMTLDNEKLIREIETFWNPIYHLKEWKWRKWLKDENDYV